MRPPARAALVACATLLLAPLGCARSDAGAPCHLVDTQGAEVRAMPGRQYLFLGSAECGSFACMATPGNAKAYCSQPCGSDSQCPSNMTCSALALDQDYLAFAKTRLPADRYQALFGQLTANSYCVMR